MEVLGYDCFRGILTTTVVLVTLLVLEFVRRWQIRQRYNLPPGPFSFPLLGHMNLLLSNAPHLIMEKFMNKYGKIFGLHIGSRYLVVLSDFKSIKETFNSRPFIDRPKTYFRVTPDMENIGEMDHDKWVDHRMLMENGLKYLGVGSQRFDEICLAELARVIPKFENECGKPSFVIYEVITSSINNTILQLLFSRWFESDHQVMTDMKRFQDRIAESFATTTPVVYYPWLDWFIRKSSFRQRDIWDSSVAIRKFVRAELEARIKVHDPDHNHDYMDLFLTEIKKRKDDPNTTFDYEHLITDCMFMIMAGSDTVRNSLEWFLMTMAHFPDVQEKVYQEIVSVLGTERLPTFVEDHGTLPYTESVILEIQRWKTLVPLNCLRWTSEDTTVQGFEIPKGTVIMNNLYTSHMDPEIWDRPREFIAGRFLSKDKTKCITPEYHVPFSIGKRDCPGDKMAIIELFLYFVTIMQKFKFSPPPGGVRFDDFARVNLQPKFPIVRVDLR